MNAKQLIAVAVAAIAAQGAFAQEASSDAWMQVASTKSRAEVQAQAGSAASIVVSGGEATVFTDHPVSTKSRDAVRAEAVANRRTTVDVYNIGA
jgi:hypothetical protein